MRVETEKKSERRVKGTRNRERNKRIEYIYIYIYIYKSQLE